MKTSDRQTRQKSRLAAAQQEAVRRREAHERLAAEECRRYRCDTHDGTHQHGACKRTACYVHGTTAQQRRKELPPLHPTMQHTDRRNRVLRGNVGNVAPPGRGR